MRRSSARLHVLGVDRILFAVDYPYASNEQAVGWLNSLPISSDDKANIAHSNAERVLRRAPS